MLKYVLMAAVALSVVSVPALAGGGCLCWMDDGSASECHIVADEAECAQKCAGYDGGATGYRYFPEGEYGTPSCEGPDGICLVTREPDEDDLDSNGNTTETIRWRYVVVVGGKGECDDGEKCKVENGVCKLWHQLHRGWKDAEHD
ncbi:MAG: hypothetical protein KAV82_08180 [Phycisphaerae bacterium]|nr:hypothetical protein [Phycisphaerae bacterium]